MKRKSRSIYFNISSRLIFRCIDFSPLVNHQVEIFSSLRLTATSWKKKTRFQAKTLLHLSVNMSGVFTVYLISCSKGCAEAHWLKHCTTRRKFDGSIPDKVIGISHWFRRHFGLGLDSACIILECQNFLLEGKGCRCQSFCVLCRNSGSLKLLEPSGPVQTCKDFALPLQDNKSKIFVTHYIQFSLSPYYTFLSVSLRAGGYFQWIKSHVICGFIFKILVCFTFIRAYLLQPWNDGAIPGYLMTVGLALVKLKTQHIS
jgi:hypothetical protein